MVITLRNGFITRLTRGLIFHAIFRHTHYPHEAGVPHEFVATSTESIKIRKDFNSISLCVRKQLRTIHQVFIHIRGQGTLKLPTNSSVWHHRRRAPLRDHDNFQPNHPAQHNPEPSTTTMLLPQSYPCSTETSTSHKQNDH